MAGDRVSPGLFDQRHNLVMQDTHNPSADGNCLGKVEDNLAAPQQADGGLVEFKHLEIAAGPGKNHPFDFAVVQRLFRIQDRNPYH